MLVAHVVTNREYAGSPLLFTQWVSQKAINGAAQNNFNAKRRKT